MTYGLEKEVSEYDLVFAAFCDEEYGGIECDKLLEFAKIIADFVTKSFL